MNIGQARVEQVLDERIAATPGIEVRWGTTVTGIATTATSVDGRDRRTGAIETPYVVGCAGARGDVVRDAIGADFEGRTFDDQFLICDIRCDLPDRELERRFHFDPEWNPGRQVLMHPCPDSTYRIDWQVPPGFDLEHERASGELDARIRQDRRRPRLRGRVVHGLPVPLALRRRRWAAAGCCWPATSRT